MTEGAPLLARLLADDDARDLLTAAWDRAALRSPFGHPAFAEAVGRWFGLTPVVLAVGDDGPDAVAVGYEKRVGPVQALALPPLTPVSAPLVVGTPTAIDVHRRQTALDALLQGISRRYAQATFRLPVGWSDARPFTWAGWEVETRYTYLADPAAPTDTWSRGPQGLVRSKGSDFQIAEGSEWIGDAARFQAAAYERKRVPFGVTRESMAALAVALADAGLARAFAAIDAASGTPAAAAVFAVDPKRQKAQYWIAGSQPGPAMTLLFAGAFERLAAAGVTNVDLGGANVPGVAHFKSQFGARLVPQLQTRLVGPRWLRVLDALRGS